MSEEKDITDHNKQEKAEHHRCFACGRIGVDHMNDGPTPDEVGQAYRWAIGVLDVHVGDDCRKLDPDLYTTDEYYSSLNPIIPERCLPVFLKHDPVNFSYEDPSSYPWPAISC